MAKKLPTIEKIINYCERRQKALHEQFVQMEDITRVEGLENLARQSAYKDVIVYIKTGVTGGSNGK